MTLKPVKKINVCRAKTLMREKLSTKPNFCQNFRERLEPLYFVTLLEDLPLLPVLVTGCSMGQKVTVYLTVTETTTKENVYNRTGNGKISLGSLLLSMSVPLIFCSHDSGEGSEGRLPQFWLPRYYLLAVIKI